MTVRVPRLHAITDRRVLSLPDLADRAAALAIGPQAAIHCRHAPSGSIHLGLTGMLLAVARHRGAVVLVNDRADIARIAGADGVHLPERGLPVADARRVAGPGALVGRSVHDVDGVGSARDEGADYAMLGPVWATATHLDRPALGLALLEKAAGLGLPVIAVGGVTPERAADCAAAGAAGVGAIRALWDADDPGSAAERFLLSLEQ